MTDIVERLRNNLLQNRILREAADEIERLQAKIERWQAQSIAQYAEIERLRAALQEIAAYPHSENGGEIARRALEHKP